MFASRSSAHHNLPSEAIVFLIDNSATSLNGDFYPSRLEAQTMAVERLISHFTKSSDKTQIAVGLMAEPDTGMLVSLTSSTMTVTRALFKIERGQKNNFAKAVRCAFLSLHHCNSEIRRKQIIAMVGSDPGQMTPEICEMLANTANIEGVNMNIVAFGDDFDANPLQTLVEKCGHNSHFVYCPPGGIILSDAILSSEIVPSVMKNYSMFGNINPYDDPDLALTLKLSMEDQPDDPELIEAMRLSLLESLKEDEQQNK